MAKEVEVLSVSDYGELAEQIAQVVGQERVRGVVDDASEYFVADLQPSLVVTPQTTQEIAAIVRTVEGSGAGIVPWGGGTMMGRGHVPTAYDVALSLSDVTNIVDFDVDNLTVTVQAGMTLAELQKHLGQEKKFLPLRPRLPQRATVGGTVAANANGPGRFHYGSVRDLVLGMRVVLADGESIHVGGKTMKNVAGYDLGKMFIGSYGSLGIITEATFRVLPEPERRAVLQVDFAELAPVLDLIARILDSELLPISLSVVTPPATDWVLQSAETTVLVVELNGSAETVDRQVRQVRTLVSDHTAVQGLSVLDGEEAFALLDRVRDFVCLGAHGTRQLAFTANVPMSTAGEFVQRIEASATEWGMKLGSLIHGGTGTINCLADGTDEGHQVRLYDNAVSAAAELGGHCVLERSTPEVRSQVPAWGRPRADWELARLLKMKFDPHGLLNRGRFVSGT